MASAPRGPVASWRHAVVAALMLALGFVAQPRPAEAVEIAPDGFGQVLIYPYYTVRGAPQGFNTLISIGNSTRSLKAIRLRFREAREGAPVGDFNLYINPQSVWTGAVFATADGAGLASADYSCAFPAISHDASKPTPFSAASYAGGPGDVSLDRTREGFFEVIEIGDYGSPYDSSAGPIAQGARNWLTQLPEDCGRVHGDDGSEAKAPAGGLYGSALVISTLRGIDHYYAATALSHFTDLAPTKADYGTPDPTRRTLADAHPAVSVVVDSAGRIIRSNWTLGIDAVSAALMNAELSGEFVLDSGTNSQTSWIVTLPTKWFYANHAKAAMAPFTAAYGAFGACEKVPNPWDSGILYDRESNTSLRILDFMGPWYLAQLCFATHSVDFKGSSNVFVSAFGLSYAGNGQDVVTGDLTAYYNGWMRLVLDPPDSSARYFAIAPLHRMASGSTTILSTSAMIESRPSVTYRGLPAIGFSVSAYFNGTLVDTYGRNVQSSYLSGTELHRLVLVE